MEKRLNRQRLISVSSYVSPQPDIPATFELLNDDTKRLILKFVGNKSYVTYGGINKHCRDVYINTKGMEKRTFVFGYAPLSVILDKIGKYERDGEFYLDFLEALSKGVVFYNRRDVLDWALEERKKYVLKKISEVAAGEGRIDILDEVWNHINNEDVKEDIFESVDQSAAGGGRLVVVKWIETKGLSIDEERCAVEAAANGHLHILKWLKEEKGLELNRNLYYYAIDGGGHLIVMKWLKDQGCPWDEYNTFQDAAKEGNLKILQWLHDEGCPWYRGLYEDDRVYEEDLEPEVVQWCHMNGYELDSTNDSWSALSIPSSSSIASSISDYISYTSNSSSISNFGS